jgi:hypothetical protein
MYVLILVGIGMEHREVHRRENACELERSEYTDGVEAWTMTLRPPCELVD